MALNLPPYEQQLISQLPRCPCCGANTSCARLGGQACTRATFLIAKSGAHNLCCQTAYWCQHVPLPPTGCQSITAKLRPSCQHTGCNVTRLSTNESNVLCRCVWCARFASRVCASLLNSPCPPPPQVASWSPGQLFHCADILGAGSARSPQTRATFCASTSGACNLRCHFAVGHRTESLAPQRLQAGDRTIAPSRLKHYVPETRNQSGVPRWCIQSVWCVQSIRFTPPVCTSACLHIGC